MLRAIDPALISLAVAAGIIAQWTQAWQCHRMKSVEGLATGTICLGLISSLTWASFGVGSGDVAQVCNNASAISSGLVIAFYLRRSGLVKARVLLGMLTAWAATCAGAVLLGMAPMLGFVGVGLAATAGLPQLISLLRRGGGEGISKPAQAIGLAAGVAWLVHGLVLGQAAVIIGAGWGLFQGTFMLMRCGSSTPGVLIALRPKLRSQAELAA